MSPSRQPTLTLVPKVETSDEALCRAFFAGDTVAFGELVRRHQEAVFRLVRRYVSSTDDAADLMQRAFLQALEAARKAGQHEVPFRPWLFRIAINLAKNQLRDRRRWASTSLEVVASQPGVDSPLAALEAAQARALTRQAVDELPPRQRDVFSLRVDAGLPFAEVGEILGISEANAKSHFHHAVQRLRETVQHLSASRGPHDP